MGAIRGRQVAAQRDTFLQNDFAERALRNADVIRFDAGWKARPDPGGDVPPPSFRLTNLDIQAYRRFVIRRRYEFQYRFASVARSRVGSLRDGEVPHAMANR